MMTDITRLMTHDHRECDDLFASAENAAARGEWDKAGHALNAFAHALETHFSAEEEILFPRFEAVTGMTEGPTRMMKADHRNMREQLDLLRDAIAQKDSSAYEGESETLLIMMQQHNMKEENILYPMCDQQLAPERTDLADKLSGHLDGASK